VNKTPYKIVFALVTQNSSKYLPAIFQNLENLSTLFSETAFFFIENDSIDSTKGMLKAWGKDKANFHLITLDGLKAIPIRTIRLEILRNTYIEAIRYQYKFKNFDCLIVVDADDAAVYPIDCQEVLNAIEFLNASSLRAAAFANQRGTYYDMWALRDSAQFSGDIWEEVLDYVIKNKCSDDIAYREVFEKRIFSISETAMPIKVSSAFGGLGIYKMKYLLGNPNPYLGSKVKIVLLDEGIQYYARWQICEHVHFHAGISNQGGEMYIYPKLINGANDGLSFPPSAFRGLLFGAQSN
jgi:hypothetical protein